MPIPESPYTLAFVNKINSAQQLGEPMSGDALMDHLRRLVGQPPGRSEKPCRRRFFRLQWIFERAPKRGLVAIKLNGRFQFVDERLYA